MTPYANFIQEYYHKMTTGEIVVGKWVRILYEKITMRRTRVLSSLCSTALRN